MKAAGKRNVAGMEDSDRWIIAILAWLLAAVAIELLTGIAQPALSEEHAVASYYDPKFARTPTASGEPYLPSELTAAHKELPLGTRVKVTNPETGREVTVRINDRGPHRADRDLDLSQRAAEEIGITARGVATVRVEEIHPPAR